MHPVNRPSDAAPPDIARVGDGEPRFLKGPATEPTAEESRGSHLLKSLGRLR